MIKIYKTPQENLVEYWAHVNKDRYINDCFVFKNGEKVRLEQTKGLGELDYGNYIVRVNKNIVSYPYVIWFLDMCWWTYSPRREMWVIISNEIDHEWYLEKFDLIDKAIL